MIPHVTLFQLNSTCRVESIEDLFKLPPNCNFLKRQISVIPSRKPRNDFFCSRWASPPINLVVSTRLAVYNSKSFKPNMSTSLFRRKDLATFKNFHPASLIAQSSACCSLTQNLFFDGEDELAGGTPTEGSNRCTFAPVATYAFTPAVALVIAPLATSGSANSSVVRYAEDDLLRILRTVLDSRPLALVSAPVVAAVPHYEEPREWSLKACFSDIYGGEAHLEYYNFFWQCEDHFATTGAIGLNRVLFTAIFLKNTALFRWQQHQHKKEAQTIISISWEGFKAFFHQNLGKSEAFVDTI